MAKAREVAAADNYTSSAPEAWVSGEIGVLEMRVRGVLLLGVLVIVLGACANSVPGRFDRIGPVAQAANAAVKHMGSISAIHVTGAMVNAANVTHKVDIRATASGDMVGTVVVNGNTVQIVRLNSTLYVKSSAKYWAAEMGGENRAFLPAWENRWARVDDNQFLLQLPQLLNPSYIAARISDRFLVIEPKSVAGAPKLTDLNGAKVLEVATAKGKVFITDEAPHRIVRIEGTVLNTDSAQPINLSIGSDEVITVQETLHAIATTVIRLRDPLDPFADADVKLNAEIDDSECNPTGCTLFATAKSAESKPLRLAYTAWIGDGTTIMARCNPTIVVVSPGKPKLWIAAPRVRNGRPIMRPSPERRCTQS